MTLCPVTLPPGVGHFHLYQSAQDGGEQQVRSEWLEEPSRMAMAGDQ